MNDLNTALMLLAVGMITVFAILSLVVLSGKTLIYLINKWAPEHPVAKKVSQASPSSMIDKQKLAAIVAAVDIWTEGRGKIVKIEAGSEK